MTARALPDTAAGLAARLTAWLVAHWLTVRRGIGEPLLPMYAALTGAAAGALVADRLVRSMWGHAIYTGTHQWRTSALALIVLWLAIGAVTALALLGAPPEEQSGWDDAG